MILTDVSDNIDADSSALFALNIEILLTDVTKPEKSIFYVDLTCARVEFPIQLVGRLPHQLCLLPHQLYGLSRQFSMNFLVFRLQNVRVNPELCHDVRI